MMKAQRLVVGKERVDSEVAVSNTEDDLNYNEIADDENMKTDEGVEVGEEESEECEVEEALR